MSYCMGRVNLHIGYSRNKLPFEFLVITCIRATDCILKLTLMIHVYSKCHLPLKEKVYSITFTLILYEYEMVYSYTVKHISLR